MWATLKHASRAYSNLAFICLHMSSFIFDFGFVRLMPMMSDVGLIRNIFWEGIVLTPLKPIFEILPIGSAFVKAFSVLEITTLPFGIPAKLMTKPLYGVFSPVIINIPASSSLNFRLSDQQELWWVIGGFLKNRTRRLLIDSCQNVPSVGKALCDSFLPSLLYGLAVPPALNPEARLDDGLLMKRKG